MEHLADFLLEYPFIIFCAPPACAAFFGAIVSLVLAVGAFRVRRVLAERRREAQERRLEREDRRREREERRASRDDWEARRRAWRQNLDAEYREIPY